MVERTLKPRAGRARLICGNSGEAEPIQLSCLGANLPCAERAAYGGEDALARAGWRRAGRRRSGRDRRNGVLMWRSQQRLPCRSSTYAAASNGNHSMTMGPMFLLGLLAPGLTCSGPMRHAPLRRAARPQSRASPPRRPAARPAGRPRRLRAGAACGRPAPPGAAARSAATRAA